MNVIIHLIILFIYTFALLTLNIPNIESDNFLKQKIYIFSGIFIFEFVIELISTVYQQKLVNFGKISQNSFQSALIAVVAYSVYNDLVWTNKISQQNLTITIFITLFIAIGYLLNRAFLGISPRINDSFNLIYSK